MGQGYRRSENFSKCHGGDVQSIPQNQAYEFHMHVRLQISQI